MTNGWDYTHDPDARPLGCNGRYGGSGPERHRRAGEPVCPRCSASKAHYARELRRGAARTPRVSKCGTYGGVARHKRLKEPTCFACKVAEAAYKADLRDRQQYPKCLAGHYMTPENTYTRPGGRVECRECRAVRKARELAAQAFRQAA